MSLEEVQQELFKHKIEILTRDLEDINLKTVVQGMESKQETIISLDVLHEADNEECADYIVLSFYNEKGTLIDKVGIPYFTDLPEHLQEIILKENAQEI